MYAAPERKKRRTFWNRERRWPLVAQDIKTNRTVGVDIRVEYLRREFDLGRLERVVRWEPDLEEEDAAGVWGVCLYNQVVKSAKHGVNRVKWRIHKSTTRV